MTEGDLFLPRSFSRSSLAMISFIYSVQKKNCLRVSHPIVNECKAKSKTKLMWLLKTFAFTFWCRTLITKIILQYIKSLHSFVVRIHKQVPMCSGICSTNMLSGHGGRQQADRRPRTLPNKQINLSKSRQEMPSTVKLNAFRQIPHTTVCLLPLLKEVSFTNCHLETIKSKHLAKRVY